MQKYHVQLLTSTYQSLQLQNDVILKLVKHIIVLVFSISPGSNSLKKYFLEGKKRNRTQMHGKLF
jgi:hypothetical protein